jgi:hypothetical protein
MTACFINIQMHFALHSLRKTEFLVTTQRPLCITPIHITQNNYSSAALNKWNGDLAIDEKAGTILSTMVGAGRKNADNQFEGVLMGDVATGTEDGAITKTGLYGFNGGV